MFNTHQEKDVNVFPHSSRSDRGASVEFSRDDSVSPTKDAIGQGRRLFRQLNDAETSTEHRTLKTTRYPSTRPPVKTKKEKKKQKQSKSKVGGGRNKKTAAKPNKEGNKVNKKTSKAKEANNGKKNSKNSSKQSKKSSEKPSGKKNKAGSKKKKKKNPKKTTTKKENKTSGENRNGSSENQERGTGLTNWASPAFILTTMLTRSWMQKSNLWYVYKKNIFPIFWAVLSVTGFTIWKNCRAQKPQNFLLISKQLEKLKISSTKRFWNSASYETFH